MMKLPCFILDQDHSTRHVRAQTSWIMKFLPSQSNLNTSK